MFLYFFCVNSKMPQNAQVLTSFTLYALQEGWL